MARDVVGRASELDAIDRLLDRAGTSLTALVLEGDAGIGKSTLWEAGVAAARERGFVVLQARPARSEESLTLGGLVDLLGGVDPELIATLPEPQRHGIEVAMLRVAASGALPDQRTLSVAVAALLRELAAHERPLLIAIDDVQWIDDSSAAVIAYAVRRLEDSRVAMILAVRRTTTRAAVLELLAAVPAERADEAALGPLPLAGLHRLFELRLGQSFPRVTLLRIEEATRGNPLWALEVGRALVRQNAAVDAAGPLPVPGTLGSLLANRISALPRPTRRALLLAAASFESSPAALDRAVPGSVDDLEPAVADGIVRVGVDAFAFAHPLFADAVLALAGASDVRLAHAALARAAASDDARARHLGRAADEPAESVATALERAAGRARDRGATLDAAALYEDAARLTPRDRPAAAGSRATRAAECLFVDLSEIVQADRILTAAIAITPPGPARAEALSLRAVIRYYHGHPPEAVALAEQALVEAGDDPRLRAMVLGRLAFLVMQLDLERGADLADEGIRLLDDGAGTGDGAGAGDDEVEPDLVANLLLLRASAELSLVRPTRPADTTWAIGLIGASGRSWEREGAEGLAFGLARLTDDLDRAIAMTHELIRAKSGPGGDDPFNLVQLSGLLCLRGDWAEARRVAEAALEGYSREGAAVYPAWGLRGVALVAAHDGRLEEARRFAEEGAARAAERGDRVLGVFHRHILGFVALSLGDWPAAEAHLSEAAALAEQTGVRHPGRFKLDGDRVEAALALGDVGSAAAIVSGLERVAAIAPTPWARAVGARSAGLLAAARGDLAAAGDALDRALDEHRDLPMPFELGRTLLAKGQVHRRRKEKRLADESLRAALEIFDALGAPVWADRTRRELTRVGRRPHAPDELTETERRVAELAARGLSARQIAERAFLAPKTVGNVLGRVYLKLGIHSRAELGAHVAASRADVDGDVAD